MRPSHLLRKYRTDILKIFSGYPMLSNLRVVGSVAKGVDTESSDIDFLVDTSPDTTLFHLGGLHEDLVELLGVDVDIIPSGAKLHPIMRASIKREAMDI